MNFKKVKLKPGKDKSIQRRHPWIFSGALITDGEQPSPGQLVEVEDHRGNFIACGFWQDGSIAVKILSFQKPDNPEELIKDNIQRAINYRRQLGLFDLQDTNCLRLIFAEGDQLPGLIVDKYDKTAVIQIHHQGWIPFLDLIASSLSESGFIDYVYCKPVGKSNSESDGGWIGEEAKTNVVLEYGHSFYIDWIEGQKTGFFLDQRENRRRLSEICKGKKVINTFSYTGGFSVYALQAGAAEVVSVDISKPAVELAHKNAELNELGERHSAVAEDVFTYLQQMEKDSDIIILDPPAFSKSRRTTHNAVQGYKRLNRLAIEKIKSGGIIFTFSCSQNINPKLFEDTVRAAAIESGRMVRVVEKLSQPADHPVNAFHPEGEYLKGLILSVE